MTPAEFLQARLDEDESVAKLAAREGGAWKQDDPVRFPGAISSLGGQVVYDEGAPDEYQGPHIVRHDPARVLREVEAGRKLLAYYTEVRSWSYPPGDGDEAVQEALEHVVRIRASAYSDHPDYQQEWKP